VTDTSTATGAAGNRTPATSGPARIVDRLGHLLAVAPSLGPARKGWQRLGFATGEPHDYFDCEAFEIALNGCGVRVVAPKRGSKPSTAFGGIVHEHLAGAPGLLGWSWACKDPEAAEKAIEQRCGRSFPQEKSAEGILLPPDLSPGATTLLETSNAAKTPEHPNRIDRVDHIVLMVNDSDAVVQAYADAFGLKPKSRSMKEARYSFMKVGGENSSVIEVVGPESPKPGPLGGRAWGVTFATPDLDGCVRAMAGEGIQMREPHAAIQGGRITSLPIPFGGMQIAVIGE
jgi:predicted enzyme related to lactoylglutathione lyase